MNKEEKNPPISVDNIYRLNGRVPLQKAIPFGLQHVLAMFVSNLAPVLIVCSAAIVRSTGEHLTSAEITQLLQCAMFAAGIGTCMQLYPIWKIGSRLPIVMGVSFTFLGSLLVICTNPDLGYEGMVGAVILGGIFEGIVGLSAKYWKRFLTPVVSACVVIAIGLSLLSVGMDFWGGGSGVEDFGAWYHLLVGTFTLVVCLVSRYLLKGVYKNLNILVGLVFGYLLAVIFTVAGVASMVDFSGISQTIQEVGVFSIPKLVFFTSHKPVFDLGAFFTIAIVFLVSAAETTGATTAVCTGALGRDIKMEELQGSLAVDGFSSGSRRIFQCYFRLLRMSSSDFFQPECRPGDHDRCDQPLHYFYRSTDFNPCLVSLAFCIGVGLTQTSGNFFAAFPQVVGDVFNGNAVAGVFVVSLLLSLLLPKSKKEKKEA